MEKKKNARNVEAMTDEEVFGAALDLLYADGMLEDPSPEQMILEVLTTFDAEVQNGGLCQFFVNSSSAYAPLVPMALKAVGAEKYRALYESFLADNGIDPHDLDSFQIQSADEFSDRLERYPFDEFDDAYYALCEEEELMIPIVAFIRQHPETIQ